MSLLKAEKGQTQIEYVLLIAVMVLVAIAGIPPLREAVASVVSGTLEAFNRNAD